MGCRAPGNGLRGEWADATSSLWGLSNLVVAGIGLLKLTFKSRRPSPRDLLGGRMNLPVQAGRRRRDRSHT